MFSLRKTAAATLAPLSLSFAQAEAQTADFTPTNDVPGNEQLVYGIMECQPPSPLDACLKVAHDTAIHDKLPILAVHQDAASGKMTTVLFFEDGRRQDIPAELILKPTAPAGPSM
ncbi:MAG: hypothetical protein DI551_01445 [Micavibrio aeruginosavorus]|uniref:Lipoprotein n=1 Tax=Micavibrio aeruginosavorus TaxID=349221 RepID=A0A2W5NCH9_9BACT|nr:MAG: hypothetical protein DI551_01445 [Micavibrio aeruginosavorus]